MSEKFMYVQQHYTVHELETLAILKALQKWEDKLIGRRLHIIMDHKALEFFKTQAYLSSRQRRWMDYMSKFDFDITYIKGEYNKVADCLSRYYKNDTSADVHEFHDYVQADRRIDPKGEDLPMGKATGSEGTSSGDPSNASHGDKKEPTAQRNPGTMGRRG
jgi:hypothetical protein